MDGVFEGEGGGGGLDFGFWFLVFDVGGVWTLGVEGCVRVWGWMMGLGSVLCFALLLWWCGVVWGEA